MLREHRSEGDGLLTFAHVAIPDILRPLSFPTSPMSSRRLLTGKERSVR
jgi:hypothetical protein